jgi:hypothetical protein
MPETLISRLDHQERKHTANHPTAQAPILPANIRQNNRQKRVLRAAKNGTFFRARLYIFIELKNSPKIAPPATGKNRGNPQQIPSRLSTFLPLPAKPVPSHLGNRLRFADFVQSAASSHNLVIRVTLTKQIHPRFTVTPHNGSREQHVCHS